MQSGFRLGLPETLEGFARLAAAEDQPERALRLAGAAAALREAMGTPLPPFWAADLERSLEPARQALSAEAWAAAWAAGRAMPLAHAVTEALAIELPVAAAPPGPTHNLALDQAESLTARELEVAALVARGLTNRQIAAALSIAERTVGTHLTNILGKLGFTSRSQVAVWAVERGLASVGRA
jgi:DNA-binding NarL/FixJ family response regulator